eukprot:6175577-Pleurochrysis_carterae.AAC.6
MVLKLKNADLSLREDVLSPAKHERIGTLCVDQQNINPPKHQSPRERVHCHCVELPQPRCRRRASRLVGDAFRRISCKGCSLEARKPGVIEVRDADRTVALIRTRSINWRLERRPEEYREVLQELHIRGEQLHYYGSHLLS